MFHSALPPIKRRSRWILIAAMSVMLLACGKKKAAADQHIVQGYRWLLSEPQDPKKALKLFQEAKNPNVPDALLGQGLAYEALKDYSKAESFLQKVDPSGNNIRAGIALARTQTMLGKQEEARKTIDRVVAKGPTELSPFLVEACLANDDARTKVALSHLDDWPVKRPQLAKATPIPAEYHLARAAVLARLGNPEPARTAKELADKANFSDDATAVSLASLAARAGQRGFAILLLGQVLEKYKHPRVLPQVAALSHLMGAHQLAEKALGLVRPKDADMLRLQALHEAVTKKPSAAKTIREALAVTTDPAQTIELRLLRAEALLRDGELKDAKTELDKVIETQPGNKEAQIEFARLEMVEKHPEAAVSRLEPMATAQATPLVHQLLAYAYVNSKHLDKAEQQLEEVLRLTPTHRQALTLLATLMVRTDGKDAALGRVKKQVEIAPKDAGLRLLLASVSRQMGKVKEAEAALREGIKVMPDQVQLWAALSRIQQARKANSEALKTLQDAEAANPKSLPITAEIAALYTRMGQGKTALPYYERVLRFAANDAILLNNTAMLYADEIGDGAKAVELAERAFQLAKSQPAITDTLGWSLYKRNAKGDLERARTLLESVRYFNTTPTAKYHLGMVLIASGTAEPGKQLLREALAHPDEFPEAEAARQALHDGS